MSLLDSLSRLSLATDDILAASNRTIADVGPFTDAVLGTHVITDIIRDAEEGEQILFTHRSVDVGGVKGPVDVRPVAVGLSSISGGVAGAAVVAEKEVDVDVLLSAALRLVDNYGSMPRARGHIEQLLDRAAEVRSRISLLEDDLEELKNSGPALPAEPELPSLKDEERAVVKIEAQLAAAKRRRDALREQIASKKRTRATHDTGHTISTPTAAARTRTRPGGGKIPNPFLARLTQHIIPANDPDSTTNISMHLASGGIPESLVDEGPPQWADDSILSVEHGGSEDVGGDSLWDESGGTEEVGEQQVEAEEEEEEEEGADATVVLAIPPAAGLSPPPSPVKTNAPPLRAASSALVPPPEPVPAPAPVAVAPPAPVEPPGAKPKPSSSTQPVKVQVTPETEANTTLIWATVGKVLVPTSNYGADSPSVQETVSILQSIASQSLNNSPSSPSTASSLQAPSEPAPAQTILTATLLLYLLRQGPSSLPSVRTALADKESESESASGLGIKALYACVAKKLLKIDRKGREATVRFE